MRSLIVSYGRFRTTSVPKRQ